MFFGIFFTDFGSKSILNKYRLFSKFERDLTEKESNELKFLVELIAVITRFQQEEISNLYYSVDMLARLYPKHLGNY